MLTPDEARLLLDSIDVTELSGLRDRALLAMMVYTFARVSAVVGMNVEDYYQQGKRWWVRLHEKGGKHHGWARPPMRIKPLSWNRTPAGLRWFST